MKANIGDWGAVVATPLERVASRPIPLIVAVLMIALAWVTWRYGVTVGHLETVLKQAPQIEYVAVTETKIGQSYPAGVLNDYCAGDWYYHKVNNSLPQEG